jgi:glycosyltransferase involved in cell wall biosynthesis
LLFVGRLVHEKGILLLVNAFPFILEKVPEARLIICGTGYLENIIKEKLYQLNIHHQVLMTGFLSQEKLVDYYTLADVAIFPSVYEPFGIVTLEAMSTRTPVIVSNVGGLSELVKDGVNGLKVRPGNIEDIVEKVILLLSNKEFAEELAEQGSNNILNGKSWSKIAEMTKELYQEILAGDEE